MYCEKDDMMNLLCERLNSSQIDKDSEDIDELCELKMQDYKGSSTIILKRITERYKRYINTIEVWESNGKCRLYLREAILKFLNESETNFKESLTLARNIDSELIKIVEEE